MSKIQKKTEQILCVCICVWIYVLLSYGKITTNKNTIPQTTTTKLIENTQRGVGGKNTHFVQHTK